MSEQLPFKSLDELLASGDSTKFIFEPYIARGAKTLLPGRPKRGKSTFAWCLAGALTNDAGEFLGSPVVHAAVLYLTEETAPGAFYTKMQRAGIPRDDPLFRVLRRADVLGQEWPEIVEGVLAAALELRETSGVEDCLVVVENLSKWAGFRENQENDSGVTGPAIDALDPLTAAGFAVLIISHAPWREDRNRGSTALEGGVDVLLFLDGTGESRTLTHRGGRLGVDPPPLNFMLAEDVGLEVLGAGRPSTGAKLAEVLRAVRELGEPTTVEVARHLGIGERTALRWLRVLEDRLKVMHVERVGGVGGGRTATWRSGINWSRFTTPSELTVSPEEGSPENG